MTLQARRRSGLLLAALAVLGGAAALAVAAATGTPEPAGTTAAAPSAPVLGAESTLPAPSPTSTVPAPAARRQAAADAAAMLAGFPVPPGARQVPAAPGPALKDLGFFARQPGQPAFGQVDQYRWWIAPGQPLAVLGWTRQYLTHHYAYIGRGSGVDSWSDDYMVDRPRGVISGMNLSVVVTPAGPGRTGIGVAALVAYDLPAS
jgi:hypothetical protein